MTDKPAATPAPVTGTLVIPIPTIRLTITGVVTPPKAETDAAD